MRIGKKTVLLDCDGVLADFIGAVLDEVHEVTGNFRNRTEVTHFDFAKSLGLSPDESRKVKKIVSEYRGWWRRLPVLPGARVGLTKLREVAEVYIVTSPWNSCETWLHEREAWLREHFDIPHSRVLAGSAKHLVSGDVFVDDKTETCQLWDENRSALWERDSTRHESFAVQWITLHNRLDTWSGRSTNSWEQLVEWAR